MANVRINWRIRCGNHLGVQIGTKGILPVVRR